MASWRTKAGCGREDGVRYDDARRRRKVSEVRRRREREREREMSSRLVSHGSCPSLASHRNRLEATPSGPRLMGLLGPCFPLSLRSEVTGGAPRANEAPRGVLVSDERSQ
ncbi:hypothetical protein HYQ44_004785 [Verticillium longisporum]|nr:hypothetical protein HYQ44_004785 [Verticillium longisporum]